MESHEQGVGQASAVKLGSEEPTGVGLLLSHTRLVEDEESGHTYLRNHLGFSHRECDPGKH
jgi:hypothetical protein